MSFSRRAARATRFSVSIPTGAPGLDRRRFVVRIPGAGPRKLLRLPRGDTRRPRTANEGVPRLGAPGAVSAALVVFITIALDPASDLEPAEGHDRAEPHAAPAPVPAPTPSATVPPVPSSRAHVLPLLRPLPRAGVSRTADRFGHGAQQSGSPMSALHATRWVRGSMANSHAAFQASGLRLLSVSPGASPISRRCLRAEAKPGFASRPRAPLVVLASTSRRRPSPSRRASASTWARSPRSRVTSRRPGRARRRGRR